jgi:hypothetical protein
MFGATPKAFWMSLKRRRPMKAEAMTWLVQRSPSTWKARSSIGLPWLRLSTGTMERRCARGGGEGSTPTPGPSFT